MKRELHVRFCEGAGVRFPRATRLVVTCETAKDCEEAERRVRLILDRLKLKPYPEETRRVELTDGKGGFDFLGCHLWKRVSGRQLERGIRRHYLQRWPSSRSIKQVMQRLKVRTSRQRNGVKDVPVLIRGLNPLLRGWGNYCRSGNAAEKLRHIDRCATRRLRIVVVKRKGRDLRECEFLAWIEDFFNGHGPHRLRGTVRHPGRHNATFQETNGKPCAGNPHARFESGLVSTISAWPREH